METLSRGSVDHGVVVKEEKRSVESNGDDPNIGKKVVNGIRKVHEEDDSSKQNPTDLGRTKQMPTTTSTRRSPALENNVSASTHKDLQDDDQLMESAKAEMGEVREENERLKTVLARIRKEYQSLQTQFFDIVQQEQQSYNKKSSTSTTSAGNTNEHEEEDPELISLSLGRSSSNSGDHQQPKRDHHEMMKTSTSWNKSKVVDHEEEFKHEGLSLALLSKTTGSANQVTSPENSLEGHEQMNKEDQDGVGEQWPPSEMLKIMKSTANTGDDEVSQQTAMKKARVSVRARCDTPTMNDGCQWRKYGQKIAKGNPCPRAYYRCTAAPACPVRKQVQRCAEDMSILITTYEGTHNHPLPISATAMASTTSAAASMLMSGSTISQPILTASATTTTTSAADLHGLNFSLTDNNSMQRQQFYLPNSSISSSPSYPTIILDLTAPPAESSSASQFNRLSSNFSTTPPRYSTTNFNFSSSSDLQPNNNTSTLPISWVNGYLSYGAQSYNKNQIGGALNLGRQPHQEHNFYQPNYLQRTTTAPQQTLTETIAAATKAITSDPSFRSALASAITSIVTGGGATVGNNAVVENILQNMKWGSSEPFPTINSTYSTSTTNANGCGSSYLNRSSSSNTQQGSLLFLPPSLPFTSTKSASTSPVDNRSHIN